MAECNRRPGTLCNFFGGTDLTCCFCGATNPSHTPELKICRIPVFVADGYSPGQCLRKRGHNGLCDVYDPRDDNEV